MGGQAPPHIGGKPPGRASGRFLVESGARQCSTSRPHLTFFYWPYPARRVTLRQMSLHRRKMRGCTIYGTVKQQRVVIHNILWYNTGSRRAWGSPARWCLLRSRGSVHPPHLLVVLSLYRVNLPRTGGALMVYQLAITSTEAAHISRAICEYQDRHSLPVILDGRLSQTAEAIRGWLLENDLTPPEDL